MKYRASENRKLACSNLAVLNPGPGEPYGVLFYILHQNLHVFEPLKLIALLNTWFIYQ